MQRILSRFITVLEWWSMLLLILMVVLVCLGVFFRYVLSASLAWYDEFASYLLVWLTFYGAVGASYHNRHIQFGTVVERFTADIRRKIEIVAEFFILGFNLVLFYYGWLLVRKMGDETAVSLAWVKMGWIYSVLPITGGIMTFISLDRLQHLVLRRELRNGVQAPWSGSSSE